MKKNPFILSIISLLLVGCMSPPGTIDMQTYETDSYSFLYPSTAKYTFDRGDGSFTLSNSKEFSFNNLGTDYSIFIHNSNNFTSCSPSITGATQMTPLSESAKKTIWGKVDNFGPYAMPPPLCEPPITAKTKEEYWSNHESDGAGAYVLCSEKDNERVLICISQMTDDPKVAEKIFSTFRWSN